MRNVGIRSEATNNSTRVFVLSSIFITMFLFYIDEGYYNFNWMKQSGNWIAFIIYFLPILAGQLLMHDIILKKYKGEGKKTVSIIGGTLIGILLAILFVFRGALILLGF